MTIVKKFTPEEAAIFIAGCRKAQQEAPAAWSYRYGQAVVNALQTAGKQMDPVPEIFYTDDDSKVDSWFWSTWVQVETE